MSIFPANHADDGMLWYGTQSRLKLLDTLTVMFPEENIYKRFSASKMKRLGRTQVTQFTPDSPISVGTQ